MDRTGTSLFLIPLVAALAFFSPLISRRGANESGRPSGPARQGQMSKSSAVPRPSRGGRSAPQAWRGGRDALEKFFARETVPLNPSDDPRTRASLTFLIATLPDPIDSGLALSFDRSLAAIQAAAQNSGYVLADFDVPWDDCLGGEPRGGASSDEFRITLQDSDEGAVPVVAPEDKCSERFAREPGFLLFSAYEEGDRSRINLLLVYLVGETPTMGIQKAAFRAALDEVATYYSCQSPGSATGEWTVPAPCTSKNQQLRILAPTFSGSAQPIDIVLSAWLDAFPDIDKNLFVTMISGSATGIAWPPPERPTQAGSGEQLSRTFDFYNTRSKLHGRFSFQSMQNTNDAVITAISDYLHRHGRLGENRVAFLVENNTAFGRNAVEALKTHNDGPSAAIKFTYITYPSQISQLRAAAERRMRTQKQASQQSQPSSSALPLSDALEDVGQRHEIEPFSPATPASSEQILANILSTISREDFDYVGIIATDVRDTIFLAQEVHQHAPSAVLFTMSSDLLFLHPEINSTLRGMLIVNSYPLNSFNQLWGLPPSTNRRFQFPDDASESTYNAAVTLLGFQTNLREFSLPFPEDQDIKNGIAPPVWISVVGRDRLWPIHAVEPPKAGGHQDYVYTLPLSQIASGAEAQYWRGIYPQLTMLLIFGFALFCMVFSLPLLQRFFIPPSSSESVRWKWLDRILGPAFFEEHRRRGELFLLAAIASVITFLFVASASVATPILVVAHRFDSPVWPIKEQVALLLTCTVSAAMGVGAVIALALQIKAKGNGKPSGSQIVFGLKLWGPVTIASGLAIISSILLSVSWIHHALANASFRDLMLYSIRSLDLTSGVSALAPLLLLSLAGFVWAASCFRRIRMLEGFESRNGFLSFPGRRFLEIGDLESKVRTYLECGPWDLPASVPVAMLTLAAAIFCMLRFVRSAETGSMYLLLWISYFSTVLALTLGVLRFFWVWKQTQTVLQHLAWTPMRTASKRFRSNFRTWPKIDLATPAPSLAPLAVAVDQIQSLLRWAQAMLAKSSLVGSYHVKVAVASAEIDPGAKTQITGELAGPEKTALSRFQDARFAAHLDQANSFLLNAREADADGNWRELLLNQYRCQENVSAMAGDISEALESDWWQELRPQAKSDTLPTEPERVFQSAEVFIAGRVWHFLAHVFRQLEMLIYGPVAGVLLLLLAISSYPFQPHNLLLWFNSAIILVFVAVALWAFVQMNRDPILSNFNGTTPGKITWDKGFVLRVILYGVVPILALLGAQFPDVIGQFISYIAPAESAHP